VDKLINEVQVSELISKPLQSLRNERHRGVGLPYYKIGRSVRYSMADVKKYVESCRIETEKLDN